MQVQDDRTPEEKQSHPWLVVGTDRFMSGWGKASGGVSYAAWACTDAMLPTIESRIAKRGDMKRVRTVYGAYRPKGRGHLHVYVVREEK